jgi:hypothetical protein
MHIQAYLRFKEQSERLVSFAVLISYAVPELVNELEAPAPSPGAVRRSDFYHKSNTCDPPVLLQTASRYEQELASYVLLSSFSFFEAFVVGAVEEFIDFHGGESEFQRRTKKRLHDRLSIDHKLFQDEIAKLRTTEKGNARDRYRTVSRALASKNFRFPGELLNTYGVKSLVEDISKLKAVQIPELLRTAFAVPLTDKEVEQFHQIRTERNNVAHGNAGPLDMRMVTSYGLFLRKLAVKTADHLSEHFFVIEKYAP